MVDYGKGKIYKIVCNVTGNCYVGSTTKERLCDRLSQHRSNYNKYLKGKHHYVSVYEVLKQNNYTILLLENYPCSSKDELYAKEYEHIKNTNCVNMKAPKRTKAQYYQDNIDKMREKNKNYILKNKQKTLDYAKKYREGNKDKIKETQKTYYENNKDKIQRKKAEWNTTEVTCECGITMKQCSIVAHKKTKKHLNYINQCQF